ncbi:MAG: amylo-alpha-1,6-glucosidase [Phycisphaerae bacterium]
MPQRFCEDAELALEREWIATNGLGGFASGTVAGALTRRYHALLLAALHPPLGRTILVAKFDETATAGGEKLGLYSNVWSTGLEHPPGCRWLRRFDVLDGVPTWCYEFGAGRLHKRVWMEHGENTTYVQYAWSGPGPTEIAGRLLVNDRDYHSLTPGDQRQMTVEAQDAGLRIRSGGGAAAAIDARLLAAPAAKAAWTPTHDWYRGFRLDFERSVGYEHVDDHLCAGVAHFTLLPGDAVALRLSAVTTPAESDAASAAASDAGGRAALAREIARSRALIATARRALPAIDDTPVAVRQLVLAADQFVVARPTADNPTGHTIIAGYPWFTDWGRDTMISLPGLTLSTGRYELAREVLRTWARHVDQGMIPNRFPDAGDQPEYNTADATLWYIQAIDAYWRATGDRETLRELFPVLREIVAWHVRGTRYGIRVDDDGLIHAGVEGVQLTWMDAKVHGRVITPRVGKPVEINALWHAGLRCLESFARELGEPAAGADFALLADRARASFERFWNAERDCLYDVLDGPGGTDARVQANQIFAVSLDHSPLTRAQQKAVVDTVERELLTWFGLRTLATHEPLYHGRYQGDIVARDEAYHQGTAWGWLLGPFVIAHHRVYRDPAAARRYLEPLFGQLWTHAIGTLAEIFDGDPPHQPRGCYAQAWTVAETLRAWQRTQGTAG